MSQILKDQALEEAIRIGDDLISRANSNSNVVFWETWVFSEEGQSVKRPSESIYSGNSGILLFFIELYLHTHNSKYLEIINGVKNWLIDYCFANPVKQKSFYTGRLGVSYALLSVYKIDNDQRTKDAALQIAWGCQIHSDNGDDLLSGTAGNILGWLNLYQNCSQQWILDQITLGALSLLDTCHLSLEAGVSWGSGPTMIKNLCGFSHGSAGVSWILNEVASLTGSDGCRWLAKAATAYENNQNKSNDIGWPDFRKDIRQQSVSSALDHLKSGNIDFLTQSKNFDFWCHGAGGIAFSRLASFRLFEDAHDLEDFYKCLSIISTRTKETIDSERSFCLCHGIAGDVLLFLAYREYLDSPQYESLTDRVILKALDYSAIRKSYIGGHFKDKTDASLFLGLAGIGYMYLKYINFVLSPNILCPTNDSTQLVSHLNTQSIQQLNVQFVVSKILARSLPQTWKEIQPNLDHYFFDLNCCQISSRLNGIFAQSGLTGIYHQSLFNYEWAKLEMKNCQRFHKHVTTISHIKNYSAWKASENSLDQLDLCELVLSNIVEIHSIPSSATFLENKYFLLKLRDGVEVQEIAINEFCYKIFSYCSTKVKYEKLELYIVETFANFIEADYLKSILRSQVHSAIDSLILIPII